MGLSESENDDIEQTYLRVWTEVNDLAKAPNSSEFGRVCQCLLAPVSTQYVGRPDSVIKRSNEGYSVEAKAVLR